MNADFYIPEHSTITKFIEYPPQQGQIVYYKQQKYIVKEVAFLLDAIKWFITLEPYA